MYSSESEETHKAIYEDMRYKELEDQKSKEGEAIVGATQALFHRDYRGATWMGVWLAVCLNMSGINIINVYAPTIFTEIKDKTQTTGGLSPIQNVYFVGAAGFVGAVLANFIVAYLSRRALFIGGHLLMGIFLVSVAICINYEQPILILLSMCSFIIVF